MATAPYLLQARALEGPLYALTRNDTHSEDSDDWASLVDRAQTLTGEGFTVWLFVDASLGPARMRCTAIHTPTPAGRRVVSQRPLRALRSSDRTLRAAGDSANTPPRPAPPPPPATAPAHGSAPRRKRRRPGGTGSGPSMSELRPSG